MRRGHPSANSRWDNSVAILTGDFLFAQASQILARLGPEAVRIQAETFSRLVTGQMAETVGPRPGQDPLDHYMHVITEKTGSLIATSGRFGAMFSGAPVEVADQIAAACEQLGVAWQLSDDVIDIASDTAQSGKTPGTDLRQGVRTLPVLYALRSLNQPGAAPCRGEQPAADARLRWLLEEADLTDEALLTEALTLLRGHHAMKESRADVLNWVHEAGPRSRRSRTCPPGPPSWPCATSWKSAPADSERRDRPRPRDSYPFGKPGSAAGRRRRCGPGQLVTTSTWH